MLDERELLGLEGQLKDYALTSEQQHVARVKLLGNVQHLITEHRQLCSDYEEEKESREKYKQMARGHTRDPFVLVLVDGDSYIFRDQYIKAGPSGGVNAAQNLDNAIKDMLHSRLSPDEVESCRVMVRIYANLSGLSKSLAKLGLVGQEARSLAPFTAGFTQARDLFDFVDAGDKKDASDFKIREIFRLFADNSHCRHIFFAGCHDVGYVSLLNPYRGQSDRITLIKGSSFHTEFTNLDLPIRELRHCFRATALGGNAVPTSPPPSKKTKGDVSRGGKPCAYYPKGLCKYGATCNNEHVDNSDTFKTPEKPVKQQEKRLTGLQLLQKYPALSARSTGEPPVPPKQQPSAVLPESRPAQATARGQMIPVNKYGDRLEILCEVPSLEAWKAYHVRKEAHKVCNSHHLAGRCEIGPDCELDHAELSPLALTALRCILKKNPCPKGSACRDPTCYVGHLCQVDDCHGGSSCRFKADKHILNMDFKVAEWVEPEFEPFTPAVPSFSSSPSSFSAAVGSKVGDSSSAGHMKKEPRLEASIPANLDAIDRTIMEHDMIDFETF